jgi:iron complex outermembrane receptor protein
MSYRKTLFSLAVCALPAASWGTEGNTSDLTELSLEQLLQVEVVSASRYAQTLAEAPASVTVIDETELRQHGYRNLAEALVTVPGVYSSNDRNYTYLGVRGFNRPGDYGTRLLLLTDGVRRNDPLYDQAMLGNESPVEVDWVKRIEFVPGPASSVYGPNALFGTVNTVMLEGGDVNGTRVTLDAGTEQTRRLGVVAGQKVDAKRDWFVGFSAYKADGDNLYFPEFDNGITNGKATGLDGEKYHKLYAKYRWGNWRLSGNFSSRKKDLATAPWGTEFGASGTWSRDENSLFELRYDGDESGGWTPAFRLYSGHYTYDGNYRYESDPDSRDRATATWHGGEYRLTYGGLTNHRLIVGVDAQWNTKVEQIYYETGPKNVILDSNEPSRTASVFLQDEWRFRPDWLVNVSLRHDTHSDFSSATSPRLALIWQATPRLTLKGIVGQAYRFPNAFERFYHDGDVTQSANPDLDPERIVSRELAAFYRFGQSGQLGISVFDNTIIDMIDQITDDQGVSTYANLDKVHAHGVELSAENRWATGYRLRGSIGWQQSRIEGGGSLADSPRLTGKLIAEAPLAAGWTASGELLGLSSRKGYSGDVPGYGIVNLKISSPLVAGLGQFGLAVHNVGDRRYYDPASAYLALRAVEQNRRQVMMRWTLPF